MSRVSYAGLVRFLRLNDVDSAARFCEPVERGEDVDERAKAAIGGVLSVVSSSVDWVGFVGVLEGETLVDVGWFG